MSFAQQDVPKAYLHTLNHLYEIESKLRRFGDPGNALRNVEKIKDAWMSQLYSDFGLFYEDPFGQPYSETRTDLEATISGSGTENLTVVEVIKPIIRGGSASYSRVVQRGIVVVQSAAPAPETAGDSN